MNRKEISTVKTRLGYIVMDMVMTEIAFFLFNIFRYYILHTRGVEMELWNYILSDKLVLEQIFVPMGLMLVYAISGFYNEPICKSRLAILTVTFWASVFNAGSIYLLILLNDVGMKRLDYLIILSLILILFIFLFIGRTIVSHISMSTLRKHGNGYRTIIIGNSHKARATAKLIKSSKARVPSIVIGFISVPGEKEIRDRSKVWQLDEIDKVCRRERVDQIVISLQTDSDSKIMELLNRLFDLNISIKIAPDTLSFVTTNIKMSDIQGTPFVDLTSPRIDNFQKNIKRISDVTLSLLAMIVLSPVYLALAIAVKLSSPGPIIYKQERLGLRQKKFYIYKFRSMYVDSEKYGPSLSHDADPRITRLGVVMRKYRLDEIPQFWNVVRGDMSLVGPRPEREYYVRQIMKETPYFGLIFQVKPGITSWGMVKFGYASTVAQMVERSRFDLLYINNMSIATDIKILIYTIRTIVTGEGK